MADVLCVNCSNWKPEQTSKVMAGYGFAYCSVKSISKAHTFSAAWPHDCDKFIKTTDEVIKARFKRIGRNIE